MEPGMHYPLYVIREPDRAGAATLRASFPDFPGAEATGRSLEELERHAQQMVEQTYAGSEQLIPAPSDAVQLHGFEKAGDDGLWVYVDIDLARVTSKAVGLQFSVLESLLQKVDAAAAERHITRAAFMTLAAVHELERH
jgi:predicted RNase H-like HicB family nuclease